MRNFSHKYFDDSLINSELQKEGVVKLKSIMSLETIRQFLNEYKILEPIINASIPNHYTNSFSIHDVNIKKKIHDLTVKYFTHELDKILIKNSYEIPIGGGICINPPFAKRGSNIHQDPSCVDEKKTYSLTVWIPLSDVDQSNGCMKFIRGSHLWGNSIRSIHTDWRFERWKSKLEEKLEVMTANVGDVIVFDSSIIHASEPNKTEETRLAINFTCIPANNSLIYYTPLFSILKPFLYKKLLLDSSFFFKESIFNTPSNSHKVLSIDLFTTLYSDRKMAKFLRSN